MRCISPKVGLRARLGRDTPPANAFAGCGGCPPVLLSLFSALCCRDGPCWSDPTGPAKARGVFTRGLPLVKHGQRNGEQAQATQHIKATFEQEKGPNNVKGTLWRCRLAHDAGKGTEHSERFRSLRGTSLHICASSAFKGLSRFPGSKDTTFCQTDRGFRLFPFCGHYLVIGEPKWPTQPKTESDH